MSWGRLIVTIVAALLILSLSRLRDQRKIWVIGIFIAGVALFFGWALEPRAHADALSTNPLTPGCPP